LASLNLGILAHVDAGKTTLTERLLFAAGVIDEIGSVDAGSTVTDSLDLERRRGITIKSAVVSFALDDVTVNLIDTPGHPDFIAEVERVLGVLDGVILVISAVEGVQAQTRVLMRALRRLGLPTLLFVNKIDRGGADPSRVFDRLSVLTPSAVAMGTVTDPGTRSASVTTIPPSLDVLAAYDEELLSAYVRDETSATPDRLRRSLIASTRAGRVHPVFFGSAISGAGIDELRAGIRDLLPSSCGDPAGPLSGTVFKVERGPAGDRIAYVRMFGGTLRTRDRLDDERRVTALAAFRHGSASPAVSVSAGQIGKVWGLGDIRIGDTLGDAPTADRWRFSPPTLETVIDAERRGALHAALTQLAEQDPLIDLRLDDARGEIAVSLYGEVQKEVIAATLAEEYGVEATFRETTTIHIERVRGTGEAVEFIKKNDNPFLGTVGLRVEPSPVGSGVEFRLGVELGSMPYAFFMAIEDTVRATLRQGLYGWSVPDCLVTLTHNGYWPRQSHAHARFDKSMSTTGADFRGLVPLVLMDALRAAGTTVCEPLLRFHLEIPADCYGPILPVLSRLSAVPGPPEIRGDVCLVDGEIPAARMYELERSLPGLTHGEGMADTEFARYAPVAGIVPTRARTDHNPLDRAEYLLHVNRRV
jgi:ribosomal protection tetracycline resistance protein